MSELVGSIKIEISEMEVDHACYDDFVDYGIKKLTVSVNPEDARLCGRALAESS